MRKAGEKGISYINGALIAANAAVFLYLEIAGAPEDAYYMYEKGALFAPAVLEDGEYYRLFTAMFMHFGIQHLLNNMLVLFVLGGSLEKALGHVRYLILYLACGAGANYASMLWEGSESTTVSAGASGAIFGVVGGLLYAVLRNRGRLGDLNARQLVIMIGFSLYLGFTSTGVNGMAHLFGLIFGVLCGALLYRKPKNLGMEE